jgi:Holliday junction DNA helicase RuvA
VLDFIRGTVESVSEDAVVLSLGGAKGPIGVRVQMPTADLARMSGEVTVHTVMQIRDEDVHLYGFATERSRDLFRDLITVSGVGPKVALAVLSFHTIDGLERAIATGDEATLGLVPGVGKKTAGRIVLDLRDKIGAIAEPVAAAPKGSPLADVREGLKGLGYSTQEIQEVLADLPTDGDVPTLMRHALRALGRDATGNGQRAGAER